MISPEMPGSARDATRVIPAPAVNDSSSGLPLFLLGFRGMPVRRWFNAQWFVLMLFRQGAGDRTEHQLVRQLVHPHR